MARIVGSCPTQGCDGKIDFDVDHPTGMVGDCECCGALFNLRTVRLC